MDINEIGGKLSSLLGDNASLFTSKLFIYSVVTIITSIVLIVLITGRLGNQDLYDTQQTRLDDSNLQLETVKATITKLMTTNVGYFKQLSLAPKSKSEIAANVTSMIGRYGLILSNIDLKNDTQDAINPEMIIEVKGRFHNLIRFGAEMNKVLSASKVEQLMISSPKSDESNKLTMRLRLMFAKPPTEEFYLSQ